MATAGKAKKPSSKVSVPDWNSNIPPVRMDVVSTSKQVGEEIMGWVACCVLIALLLPLLGMLYVDILETKHEAKSQVEKVEKLRREIEQQNRNEKK